MLKHAGRDGRVQARFVDPDFHRRLSVEDLLAALTEQADDTTSRQFAGAPQLFDYHFVSASIDSCAIRSYDFVRAIWRRAS
jgi:hypothetical protein